MISTRSLSIYNSRYIYHFLNSCFFVCLFLRFNWAIPQKLQTEFCDTTCKFQGQKPRPMETPREFSLNKPGNSTSFLTDPWNMLFLLYPLKLHVLNPHVCIFFWNSQMSGTFSPVYSCRISIFYIT